MLDLGLTTSHLYAALRIDVTFGLRDGTQSIGSGSGFAVARPSGAIFVITARHVVDPQLAIPKHIGATFLKARVRGWNHAVPVTAMTQVDLELSAPPLFHSDQEVDVAALAVMPPMIWNLVKLEQFAPLNLLAKSFEFDQDVRVGDFIASPGFATLPSVQTDRPTLLTGIISSDPRVPVEVTRGQSRVKAVLYQSLSRSGLSGAPVFVTQRGLNFGEGINGPAHRPMRLVGVNGGSFQDQNSLPLQFSYFTRSDAVLDLIPPSS